MEEVSIKNFINTHYVVNNIQINNIQYTNLLKYIKPLRQNYARKLTVFLKKFLSRTTRDGLVFY